MGTTDYHMKRIQLENRTDLKSEIPLESPYCIFIDPSSACNFKCKFCMNHKIQNPQIMNFDLYKSIIDSLQEFENPIKTIRLYGFGEPLINKNFCDMVKYAKQSSKVLSVDTTTNASFLCRRFNLDLIASGIDRINISIEGIGSGQYKKFTGRDISFYDLIENIEHLYVNKKSTIIFIKINGDYLSEEEIKMFYDVFTPISDGCDVEYTMSCWYGIEVENKNIRVGVYGQPREDVKVCPYIFYSLMVQASGEVSVCFLDWDKKMVMGDVRKNSIKSIWNSDEFKMFRINMLRGARNSICANCDQLKAGMPVNLDEYAEDILRRIQ